MGRENLVPFRDSGGRNLKFEALGAGKHLHSPSKFNANYRRPKPIGQLLHTIVHQSSKLARRLHALGHGPAPLRSPQEG
jgi:hypothetical protein